MTMIDRQLLAVAVLSDDEAFAAAYIAAVLLLLVHLSKLFLGDAVVPLVICGLPSAFSRAIQLSRCSGREGFFTRPTLLRSEVTVRIFHRHLLSRRRTGLGSGLSRREFP